MGFVVVPADSQFEFPPVDYADDDGLLAVGGPLSPPQVIAAYRQGIFPWPIAVGRRTVLAWFAPDPRAVIELDHLHVSRRLRRRIRTGRFMVTVDRVFSDVMRQCAAPRADESGTWITAEMIRVYTQLHHRGVAHSIEVWLEDDLVGGLYGIALGGFFAGESMFHRVRDGSKIALAYLVAHLLARGFVMFDIQQTTPHSVRMGASEISRRQFMKRLHAALALPVTFGHEIDTSHLATVIDQTPRDSG